MSRGENELVRWLQQRFAATSARVAIGIGDDLAAVRLNGSLVAVTADMLLDGVHFDTKSHSFGEIGRKALACSLSDCAGMACNPRAATVSIALNERMTIEDVQALYEGMAALADAYDCPIVGGDTTSWSNPLAIDVAVLAEPMAAEPVRRSGARGYDLVYVSGTLGGSIRGSHLTFEPRIALARRLSSDPGLHALMDISDGLALDLHRLCVASGCDADLEESGLLAVASEDARDLAGGDDRLVLEHVLSDGEDFELLVIGSGIVNAELKVVGRIVPAIQAGEGSLTLLRSDGTTAPIEPKGYEHFR